MSYHKPNTGNTMNDYFSSLLDFVTLAPNLLNVKNEHSFQIWLEKLEQIDKRSLILYLRKHKNDIPDAWIKIAEKRYKTNITTVG